MSVAELPQKLDMRHVGSVIALDQVAPWWWRRAVPSVQAATQRLEAELPQMAVLMPARFPVSQLGSGTFDHCPPE
jgi:hypothetical protein